MINHQPDALISSQKTALLFGGTGLVGRAVLDVLAHHDMYSRVVVFVRNPMTCDNPKIQVIQVDFEKLTEYSPLIQGNDLYICLGTTMNKAGSKAAFVKVDLTYNLIISRIAAANGVNQIILLSAVGAKADSTFFYNRVKGALEDEVKSLPFWAIHILRPAVLLGERPERRVGEEIAGKLSHWVNGHLVRLGKYTPVRAQEVAYTMVNVAGRLVPGVHYYSSDQIHSWSYNSSVNFT